MSMRNTILATRRLLGLGLLLASLAMTGALAANLDQAKQRGMVCELPTGYLKATAGATADVQAMVTNINGKRKQEYGRIAREHGVTPDQVAKLTAKKLSPKCQ